MKTILLFIYCLSAAHCFSQTRYPSDKVQLAIQTYAFLKGQHAALKKVAGQFPAFTKQVSELEKNARPVFGRAERNIEDFLRQELNDSQFNAVEKHIDSLINDQLKDPIQKKEYAGSFLEQVKDKIAFSSNVAVPKGVISFAYHDAPHEEVTDGHIINFSTEDHPKAEDAVLRLPIPKSWRADEAEMPGTVQEFTSCDGKGNEKIIIVIHELSEEDQNMILTEQSVSEMIPPQSRLIRTENVKIDGMPGMMVETEEILEIALKKMKVRMLQFMCTDKQKLYCLQGSIGPVALNHNLDIHIQKYEPLFRLVAQGTKIEN
jgi:hypothetical protein